MAKRGQGKTRHKQSDGSGVSDRINDLFASEVGQVNSSIDEEIGVESQTEKSPHSASESPVQNRDPLTLPDQIRIEEIDGRKFILFEDAPQDIWDVSILPVENRLKEPLVKAIALVLAQMDRGNSRKTKYKDFVYGYVKYISETGRSPMCIEDLNKEHISSFTDWLSNVVSERSGEKLTIGNRSHKLSSARDVLEKLSRAYPQIDIQEMFPPNPWAKLVKETRNSTKALENDLFVSLINYVENNLKLLLSELERHLPQEAFGGSVDEDGKHYIGSEAYQAAARMIDKFGYVPQMNEVVSFLLEERAGNRVSSRIKPRDVLLCCGPDSKQLYLFFLYLLIYTAFNEQPIRDTELGDIESFELGGFIHTTFRNEKRRAGSAVRIKFVEDVNAKLSVARAISVLVTWTRQIRGVAQKDVKRRLLLYVTKSRQPQRSVASFASMRFDRAADAVMRNNSNRISKLLKGRFIGTRSVRLASAELLHDAFNGDLVLLSVALGHSSTITTDHNYRTLAARDADERRLAAALQLRERYLESEGLVDPRNSRDLSEVSGATPGWGCMDNLDSPFLDQAKGRPCRAYPMCPACPLGVPLVKDKPYLLARTVQLFGKIDELTERIGPKRVAARYGGLLRYLSLYHERLSADPDCEASAALLVLNPLPDLE